MSIRKKGSRNINVDGTDYRWRIRRKATYDQWAYGDGTLTIAVETSQSPGTVLLAFTDHPHPEDNPSTDPVTPRHVAECIRKALSDGWQPNLNGPQFVLHYRSVEDRQG